MMKRYRYRLYPDESQQGMLAKVFGCARVVFNDGLAASRAAYEAGEAPAPVRGAGTANGAVQKDRGTGLAGRGHRRGVAAVDCATLRTAYSKFFGRLAKRKAGKLPKGMRVGAPRFKSRKDNRQSFRIAGRDNTRVRKVSRNRAQVWIPKIGWVGFALSRPLPSDPSSYTVVREPDGRHYVSFVVRHLPG